MGANYGKGFCSCDRPPAEETTMGVVKDKPSSEYATVGAPDVTQIPESMRATDSSTSQVNDARDDFTFREKSVSNSTPSSAGTPSTEASTSVEQLEPNLIVEEKVKSAIASIPSFNVLEKLTSVQLTAYHALADRVKQNRVDVKSQLWPPDSFEQCLLRFLRARKYDVDKAWAMLSATMEWRQKVNPMVLVDMPPEQVAGLPREMIQQHFPMWHQGYCKKGRPVMFKNFGHTRIAAMCEHTTMDHLVNFHISVNEKASRLCAEQSKKLNKEIETTVYVLDVNGWQPWGFTAAFEFCRHMAKIDSDHYPERLGNLYVINSARIVYYFWKLIKGFLDPVTVAKVQIFAERETWESVLLECIDKDQLPKEYGGTGIHRLHDPLQLWASSEGDV